MLCGGRLAVFGPPCQIRKSVWYSIRLQRSLFMERWFHLAGWFLILNTGAAAIAVWAQRGRPAVNAPTAVTDAQHGRPSAKRAGPAPVPSPGGTPPPPKEIDPNDPAVPPLDDAALASARQDPIFQDIERFAREYAADAEAHLRYLGRSRPEDALSGAGGPLAETSPGRNVPAPRSDLQLRLRQSRHLIAAAEQAARLAHRYDTQGCQAASRQAFDIADQCRRMAAAILADIESPPPPQPAPNSSEPSPTGDAST